MSKEVVIGVDIGTSYTKAFAYARSGQVVGVWRLPSPRFNESLVVVEANRWWFLFRKVVSGLLKEGMRSFPHPGKIAGMCISAITPTLVVFDARNPDLAYGILYSTPVEEINTKLNSIEQITAKRIQILNQRARNERFRRPCITDLVGYINWRLTGELTINNIALSELNVKIARNRKVVLADGYPPLRVVTPIENIGYTRESFEPLLIPNIPISGGCSDTAASVVASGMKQEGEEMLYLGTFGSYLKLLIGVDEFLHEPFLKKPFCWLLSVPRFGPTVEYLAQRWFQRKSATESLLAFDLAASQAPPGAKGALFLVPRLGKNYSVIGEYRFVPSQEGYLDAISVKARAVMESLAYAILVKNTLSNKVLFVSGGGARSKIWLSALAAVLGRKLYFNNMAWEALGSAYIAAKMAWGDQSPHLSRHSVIPNLPSGYKNIVNGNIERAEVLYERSGWLFH